MTRGIRAGPGDSAGARDPLAHRESGAALGIDKVTGTLEPGKMADVVIWNGTPFSVYALAEQVFIDGALAFDRANPPQQPRSDFLLGQPGCGRTAMRTLIRSSRCCSCVHARERAGRSDPRRHRAHGRRARHADERRCADPRRQDRGGRHWPERAGRRHDSSMRRVARSRRPVRRTVGDRRRRSESRADHRRCSA